MGSVGYRLSEYLHRNGAKLLYSDINRDNLARCVSEFGGEVLEGNAFYSAKCDVLSPCAIGGVINEKTIPLIQAPILAGGANNILEDEELDGQRLKDRGILYAPDFAINAGGLISVDCERMGWSEQTAMDHTAKIFDTVRDVLDRAARDNITTVAAANALAEARIDYIASLKRLHVRPEA